MHDLLTSSWCKCVFNRYRRRLRPKVLRPFLASWWHVVRGTGTIMCSLFYRGKSCIFFLEISDACACKLKYLGDSNWAEDSYHFLSYQAGNDRAWLNSEANPYLIENSPPHNDVEEWALEKWALELRGSPQCKLLTSALSIIYMRKNASIST